MKLDEPLSFSSVLGQKIIIDSIKRALIEDKIANAYIFSGDRGTGRRLTASLFARSLNCMGIKGKSPCGTCSSCLKSMSGNHPNIKWIKPTGNSIKIKQIWDVINDVSKKAVEEGYKIVIFENADKMTIDAQNAFLKTLEEPPSDTIFILIADNNNALLPTIQSRCQIFNFRPLNNKIIEQYLKEHFDKPEAQITMAVFASEGSLGKAIDIIQDDAFLIKRKRYAELINKLRGKSFHDIALLSDELLQSRQDAEKFLLFIASFYRDILIIKELADTKDSLLINSDLKDEMAMHSDFLTIQDINCIMEIINNGSRSIRFNVSFKNSIDNMLLNIMEVCNGKGCRH